MFYAARSLLRSLLSLSLLLVSFGSPLAAQDSPETFRWIDFHSPKDQDVVNWVTRSLESEKWTAIREIAVEYDSALVVTTLRQSPQALVAADTFNVWSASLTSHTVTPLLKGVNLQLLDWMLFETGHPREMGAIYDDCSECSATEFFTAFHYDMGQHAWEARWLRGTQAIPLRAPAPPGVTMTEVYAMVADGNGHEVVGTWSHFDYGGQKPPEDYVYRYDVDSTSHKERTELLAGSEANAMKRRVCLATDAVRGLAKGQDSPQCHEIVSPRAEGTRSRPGPGPA